MSYQEAAVGTASLYRSWGTKISFAVGFTAHHGTLVAGSKAVNSGPQLYSLHNPFLL